MDADYITNGGDTDTNTKGEQQAPPRKPFLQIRPGVPLPFLASLFPWLKDRANTATPATPPPAAPTPSEPPTPVEAPVAPAPVQPAPNSSNVLMSLDDFARFLDAVENLLKPVPQLWHGFVHILEPFLPPPSNPQEAAG